MNSDLQDKALIFAAKAHHTQLRKGTDIPYFIHPVSVAMTLLQMGCDDTVIVAGLLHDVVEDTPTTLADVEREFGAEVAAIVGGASEPDHNKADWETRKQHTINYLKTAPLPVKLVSCADKYQNICTLIRDYADQGEAVWQRFNRGKPQQAWYYRGLAASLPYDVPNPHRYPIFTRFIQLVDQLFGKE